MKLAIFDLDNTLIAGDSDHAWGEFMVSRGLVDTQSYRATNDRFYADYERGELDLEAYLSFSLQPLRQLGENQLLELHESFMREVIEPMHLAAAVDLLAHHRAQGDFLLIITSTNDFITAPIARWLGVDHLLATRAQKVSGQFTGRIDGIACFREGKVTRLQQWLEEQAAGLGIAEEGRDAWFYSDSINDLPLLEYVERPVAVDPDPTLRDIACRNNWPIISLRDTSP